MTRSPVRLRLRAQSFAFALGKPATMGLDGRFDFERSGLGSRTRDSGQGGLAATRSVGP